MVFTVRLIGSVLCLLYLRRDVRAEAMASLLSTGSSRRQPGHIKRSFSGGSWGKSKSNLKKNNLKLHWINCCLLVFRCIKCNKKNRLIDFFIHLIN